MIIAVFVVVLLVMTPGLHGFIINANAATFGDPPHTVKHLDVVKYLGKWYQTYTSPSVLNTFQKGGLCVTGYYGLDNDTTITVLNSERVNSPTGQLKVIRGFATKTGVVGQLEITLNNVSKPAQYWILELGPKTFGSDKLYEYSVVSNSCKDALFVLARNTTDFKIKYEAETLEFLQDQGFTTIFNKPVPTYQGSDCLYNDDTKEIF